MQKKFKFGSIQSILKIQQLKKSYKIHLPSIFNISIKPRITKRYLIHVIHPLMEISLISYFIKFNILAPMNNILPQNIYKNLNQISITRFYADIKFPFSFTSLKNRYRRLLIIFFILSYILILTSSYIKCEGRHHKWLNLSAFVRKLIEKVLVIDVCERRREKKVMVRVIQDD